ncbi:hypothetical protein ACW7GZ_03970 [Luteimonas sp. A537]
MKLKNTISLPFLFIFIASGVACADNQNLGRSFRAIADQFSFDRGNRTANIPLDVTVSGWAVSCSRTRAIVWGHDNNLVEMGAPPVVKVYLIDIERDEPINHYTVTRGPYEVTFSRDQSRATVDDYVVDQASGEVIGMTEDINLAAESCPLFSGKQSD